VDQLQVFLVLNYSLKRLKTVLLEITVPVAN
jgi:hypothetical protein